MARYELLDNVAHADLRVVAGFGRKFGDDVGMLPAFPTEYAELQREYPIFFKKDPSGQWHSVVLLGFEERENLFLADGRWNAGYLPGAAARGPFVIGFEERRVDGELRQEPVIHVDVEHPRVTTGAGEPLFLPQGGNTPYLEHIAGVLRGIRDGTDIGVAMFAAFDALGLIQPVKLDVQLNEHDRVSVTGLHTIDHDVLAALDGDALLALNKAGYLQGAFLVMASMQNMRRLIAEKQRRLRARDAGADNGGA